MVKISQRCWLAWHKNNEEETFVHTLKNSHSITLAHSGRVRTLFAASNSYFHTLILYIFWEWMEWTCRHKNSWKWKISRVHCHCHHCREEQCNGICQKCRSLFCEVPAVQPRLNEQLLQILLIRTTWRCTNIRFFVSIASSARWYKIMLSESVSVSGSKRRSAGEEEFWYSNWSQRHILWSAKRWAIYFSTLVRKVVLSECIWQ